MHTICHSVPSPETARYTSANCSQVSKYKLAEPSLLWYYQALPLLFQEEEYLEHVLKCPVAVATDTRISALQTLLDTLTKANTPQPIITAIQYGSHHWTAGNDPSMKRTLTRGSLLAGDDLLTVPFAEQVHSIGWHQFFLGRVSQSWEKVYKSYLGKPTTQEASFCEYTRGIWNHRNLFLHGAAEEKAQKILSELHEKVSAAYAEFQENPAYC
jgi:hypothetical protein